MSDKFFDVTVLESGFTVYRVKGRADDTIETIRAAVMAGEVELSDVVKSDVVSADVDEIEEV